MQSVIVIPARQGSSRFFNKPQAYVAGVPLLQRVWRLAQAVKGVDGVWVATDSPQIAAFARGFGAQVVITEAPCRNGTERVFVALQQLRLQPDIVINLQGDAVLTPPWVVQ